MADLTALIAAARDEVAAAADVAALESVRVRWLGKKGTFTEQLKELGRLPPTERPAAGARINEAKEALTRVRGKVGVAPGPPVNRKSGATFGAEPACHRVEDSIGRSVMGKLNRAKQRGRR